MKLTIITASFGSNKTATYVPQTISNIEIRYHHFTDKNFPTRKNAMSARLLSKIPKMFAWQLVPNQDFYMWVDDSFSLKCNAVEKFYNDLGENDMAIFKHPWRTTVAEEVQFLKDKIEQRNKYVCSRYSGEDIDGLLEEIKSASDTLYASGIFLYRNSQKVQDMMKDWWYYTSRYHQCCQLSLPYVLNKHDIQISVINEDIYKSQYAEFVR